MDLQVLLDQLRNAHLAAGAKSRKLSPECSLRFAACLEAAYLRALREAPADAVPIGPPERAVAPASVQLQNLTVLCHLAPPQIDEHQEGLSRGRDDDPFSHTEGANRVFTATPTSFRRRTPGALSRRGNAGLRPSPQAAKRNPAAPDGIPGARVACRRIFVQIAPLLSAIFSHKLQDVSSAISPRLPETAV
jgi:hypothetical protein